MSSKTLLSPNAFFWSANNGNFNFAPPQPLTTGVPSDAIIQFLTLNDDARESLFFYLEDEVRPGYKARLTDEEWGPNQYFPIGFLPGGFIPGDADDDGDLDLYCIDNAARVIFSFRNDANLRFNALHIERVLAFRLPEISAEATSTRMDGSTCSSVSGYRYPTPPAVAGTRRRRMDGAPDRFPAVLPALPFPGRYGRRWRPRYRRHQRVHAVIYYPNEGNGTLFGSLSR
ncbi:MAG: hypothetical protein H6560_11870 [Lewinellaceae bacterium]|nr:hypothetical protein [Lewinellaceae bacterium]